MRKRRGDSKLYTLEQDQQLEIVSRLNARDGTLREVSGWIKTALGVSVSLSSLSEFNSWWQLQNRMQRTEGVLQQVKEDLEKGDHGLTPDEITKVLDLQFMAASAQEGDAKTYVAMNHVMLGRRKLDLDKQKIDLDARRIAVLEKKAAYMDDLKAAAKGKKVSEMDATERQALLDLVDQKMGLI